MNGALSTLPQGILTDPRQAAIMQMGLSLMGSSGPSRMPVSFGQQLGQAGMQGLQAGQQAQQSNQQNQIFQMKLAEQAQAEAERKKRADALAALAQDPRFAGMGNLLQVAPQDAIDRAMPKPTAADSPFSKINPKDYTPESVRQFSMTRNPADLVAASGGPSSDLGKLESDFKAGLIPQADYEAKKKKLTTHSPLVNVDTRQEGEFGKVVGREMGEQYAGLLKADMNAPVTIGKYEKLGSLLSNVNTGKFKGTTLELKAAAKSLGVDLNALGVGDDVAPAQAARALTNQLALEMRNPAGGAGMPGALSDKDREFLIQSIPGLENDPGAVTTMIDYRVRLAKREQQVAKMARAYRKKNGKFDEDFFDELKEWSDKNPLFPESAAPKPSTPAGGWTPDKEQRYQELLRKQRGS